MAETTYTHNGAHEVIFTEGNHRYKVDGQYKVGVTTILGILAKDALAPWAAGMVVKYIEENCVQFELRGGVLDEYVVSPEQLKKAKKYHTTYKDDAADIGKAVHKWIENYFKNIPTEVTPDMEPSVKAFLAWEEKFKPLVLSSERRLYSEELDICGTSDLLAMIDGRRVVLDFKTGKPEEEYNAVKHAKTGLKRAYTTVYMQDALYDIAMHEEDFVYADQYAALYLPVTGGYEYFVNNKVGKFRALARSLVASYKLLKEAEFINTWNGDK